MAGDDLGEARQRIPAGETIIDEGQLFVMGGFGATKELPCAVILTDRAVHVFHGRKRMQNTLPLRSITRARLVEVHPRLLVGKVQQLGLSHATSNQFGAQVTILRARPSSRDDGKRVLEAIAARAGATATASSSTSGDLADLLRKLAELRDAGVLTDEEFAAKKAQLLA